MKGKQQSVHASDENKSIDSSVVIVGGGPTGLFLSALLSQYGIPFTLIEARYPETVARHPQAHYINLRSMEILRHHFPNSLYPKILQAMPDVREWEGFTFSHSILGRQFARVVHPVVALKNGQDGNGVLEPISGREDHDSDSFSHSFHGREGPSNDRCSVCNPGHLAQNIFSTLLLEQVTSDVDRFNDISAEKSRVLHGVTVLDVVDSGGQSGTLYPITVRTSFGQTYNAKYVVAADGSSSRIRLHHLPDTSDKTEPIQHLMNIHFRTAPYLSNILMKRKDRIGMLHFVYNPNVVGAFVCHNVRHGEWVLQLPYFPPFETASDYTEKRVKCMIAAGFWGDKQMDMNININSDIQILHIKPWTMNAHVSETYLLGESKRIILAGDAAHVFPPAGGFGMNTGLQDAHNLAWRLALLCKGDHINKGNYVYRIRADLLNSYNYERRRIAAANAALSLRNYHRTLELAKACFLNADHPVMLKGLMEMPPMNMIPFSLRQNAFQLAVKAALLPLSSLAKEGHLIGEQIVGSVRRILKSGGGLPLLFPRFEIGFSYDGHQALQDGLDDTAGFSPTITVGYRLPHIDIYVIGRRGRIEYFGDWSSNLQLSRSQQEKATAEFMSHLTMTDLESQINMRWLKPEKPHFLLVATGNVVTERGITPKSSMVEDIAKDMTTGSPIAIDVVRIFGNLQMAKLSVLNENDCTGDIEYSSLIMYDPINKFKRIVFESRHAKDAGMTIDDMSSLVLVRPDGHVAYVSSFRDQDINRMKQFLALGIQKVLDGYRQ